MFIETYYIDTDICERLIRTFHSHPRMDPTQSPMNFENGKLVHASPDIKESVDLSLTLDESLQYPVIAEYIDALQECTEQYKIKYPSCDMYSAWRITRPINIQWYKPGQAYHAWHAERCSGNPITVTRHLVFMTYLNTVNDKGGTQWLNQNLEINAEIGKTVIWPADWTFTHRGVPSPSEHKYIITGWFNYVDE
jgi:hypothetical protein